MDDWTSEDLADAYRSAIAMARAGWLNDGEGIAALWNGAENKQALIYALSRLPSTLLRAASEREGYTVDPDEVLTGLLQNLPLLIDTDEENDR